MMWRLRLWGWWGGSEGVLTALPCLAYTLPVYMLFLAVADAQLFDCRARKLEGCLLGTGAVVKSAAVFDGLVCTCKSALSTDSDMWVMVGGDTGQ